VDDEGKLLGNISATDLRVIGYDGNFLSLLLCPLDHFCSFIPKNTTIPGPICVSPVNTLEEVLLKITLTRVHRVFVVDEQKLIGVISLQDILEVFASK